MDSPDPTRADVRPFEWPVVVRYYEADQQGVVFNMWYLGWFDEAMTAFLTARGVPYAELTAAGYDMQLVHSEVDWRDGARFGDSGLSVAVATASVGRTSYALDFSVRRSGQSIVDGRTVYVCVAADGSGKRPLPGFLRAALGEPAPLRPADPPRAS